MRLERVAVSRELLPSVHPTLSGCVVVLWLVRLTLALLAIACFSVAVTNWSSSTVIVIKNGATASCDLSLYNIMRLTTDVDLP